MGMAQHQETASHPQAHAPFPLSARAARAWPFFTGFVVIFGLDQLTKHLVRAYLDPGQSIPERGFFRLTHISNTGTAFGLLTNRTFFLIVGSFVAIGILVWYYRSHPSPGVWLRVLMGVMLGGAISNLLDRIRFGQVTDFIDIGVGTTRWPAFNVADSSIVVGLVILAFLALKPPGAKATPGNSSSPSQPS